MSPCQNCHAGCCRAFAVPITGADIVRIERELGRPFEDFACRWEDSEGQIAGDLAPHFFFDDEPETPFVICLKHEASNLFPRITKCQFLVEERPSPAAPLGRGHCGIYEHRPLACRTFPTRLSRSGQTAEIHAVPKRGRENDPHPAFDLCGEPWTPQDLDPISTVQNLVLIQFEMQFFRQLADAWNRSPRSFDVFPEFLRLVYQNRVVDDSQHGQTVSFPGRTSRTDTGFRLRAA